LFFGFIARLDSVSSKPSRGQSESVSIGLGHGMEHDSSLDSVFMYYQ